MSFWDMTSEADSPKKDPCARYREFIEKVVAYVDELEANGVMDYPEELLRKSARQVLGENG